MKLTILGSGSSGNCYLLHNEAECLVIEAGVPFREVKKALNFDVDKIHGVIVTHEHGDHAAYINQYLQAGIPVLRPWHESGIDALSYPLTAGFLPFTVKVFDQVHDVPCYGFLISHREMGRLLFATDTEYVKYRFKSLNHIMIECNYSVRLIRSAYHEGLRDRVRMTHMELETCKDFIRANQSKDLKSVCLMHLSDQTSDEGGFRREIEELVTCPVYVADKGLEYEL